MTCGLVDHISPGMFREKNERNDPDDGGKSTRPVRAPRRTAITAVTTTKKRHDIAMGRGLTSGNGCISSSL